jgi:hypothetical protein
MPSSQRSKRSRVNSQCRHWHKNMSYTYHGTNGIIALPGRSISTFPSGLVRVDRTYAVRADRASVVRREFAAGNLLPFDDGTPAIDGLYIFPEPQETRRDDGFVEFKVSGYGRTNTIGQTTSTIEQGEAILTQTSPGGGESRQIIPVAIEVITTQSVAFNTLPIGEILPEAIPINIYIYQDKKFKKIEEAFKPGTTFRRVSNNTLATTTTILDIIPIIREAPGTQFGTFREVIFRFSAEASILQIISTTPG